MDGRVRRDIDRRLVRGLMRGAARHPEVGLDFAALFGQQHREQAPGPKACAVHDSSRVRRAVL